VSLKPFSAAFRWLSSTASGTPARRKGLRIGIAVRYRGQHKADAATSGVFQWAGARCVEVEGRISIWCRARMNHDLIAGCRDPMRQARLAEVLGACVQGTAEESGRSNQPSAAVPLKHHLRTVPACDPGQEPTARRLRLRWPHLQQLHGTAWLSFNYRQIQLQPRSITTISQRICSASHARTLSSGVHAPRPRAISMDVSMDMDTRHTRAVGA
jgi:hypothetical protein